MACPVMTALSAACAAVHDLEVPIGLGADVVLGEQVTALASSVAGLQAELAVRMAALERTAPPPTDVRGEATRAGVPSRQSSQLRRLGVFTSEHPDLQSAWLDRTVTTEQVGIVDKGADRLATQALRDELVAGLLPLLAPLDARSTRRLVDVAVDQLQPGDPDVDELTDHAARYLDWSRTPGGGMALQGFLPAAEAAGLSAAIDALVGSLRVEGDGLTPGQRRADALAALVAVAGQNGLPTGGGLPPAMTLTVSLDEAARVALRDPAQFGRGCVQRTQSGSVVGSRPAGDATVRFGICCAAITPILSGSPAPKSLADRIARTKTRPLAVGRAVRLATPAQRRALHLRDGGCAIPDCGIAAAYTEPHHVVPWSLGGATDLDSLVQLCWVHHRLTELGRFRFTRRRPGEVKPPGALEHSLYWITPAAAS